ncbi:MAG: hypothetical protein COA46_12195 [Porticoccaceae bacterium]|nr:MAG: hypothetical protein COA46_12195 [Porticoccaceae bacterium]
MSNKELIEISEARKAYKKQYGVDPTSLTVTVETFHKILLALYGNTAIDYRTIPLAVYDGMKVLVDDQEQEDWKITAD